MRRSLASLLASSLAVAVLAACGDDDDRAAVDDPVVGYCLTFDGIDDGTRNFVGRALLDAFGRRLDELDRLDEQAPVVAEFLSSGPERYAPFLAQRSASEIEPSTATFASTVRSAVDQQSLEPLGSTEFNVAVLVLIDLCDPVVQET